MKIRTDFVTNSSSSSFIACGVFSEELARFVVEILSGKTRTFSEYQVGELEVSGNIVSVTTTLDYGDFYIHDILGDFDKRTNDEREADDEEANTPDTILTALSAFLPIQTEEQGERLEKLLKEAADRGDTLASVYIDQTDGFEARQFFAHDFSSGKTKGKLPPRKAETNPWLQKYGQWVVENPKIEFAGKIFVFTGLGHNSEKDHPVVSAITQKGGQYRSSVSGRTDYLIVNPEDAGDTKINAVIAQHKKGKNIQVILLQDMERILFPDRSGQVSNKSVLRESAAQKVNTTKRSKQWDKPDEPRVYIGVKSKEFVEFIWEIKGEKCTYLESWEDNIELYIDGDIVTLSEPTDLQGYDWNAWTASKLADDHWHLIMSFCLILPVRPSDRWERLERILERAIATDNVVVRSNYEPEFDREYISQEDFINARLVFEHLTIVACREKENGSATLVVPSFATVSSKVFQNCKITKHIITEEGFVVLESGAFSHCKSLERLTLVNVGEILRRQLCEGCSSLEEVKLPEGIYRIDERAFSGCVNLEKINIPDTVMFIDPTAFVDCVKLPRDIQEKIRALSDWDAFDGQISEAEAYIQDHGEGDYCFDHLNFYKTFPDGMQHGFGRRWSYKELFEKKANIERWHKIHMPYFDEPQNLLKGKVTYTVYANKDVVIDMSAYGWQRQNKFSESVDYLVVDTTNIPSFDRFLYKMRAIDSGAWKTAANFGLNALEKAIEAKKAGSNIQIITREYLESCIAKNAFIEKFVFPTKAEKQAIEAQHRVEKQAEREDRIAELLLSMKDQCESTGIKYSTMADFWGDSRLRGLKLLWIEQHIQKHYQQKTEEYLMQNGMLMTEKERILARIEEVLDILTQRYVGANKKAMSVRDVAKENPDVDMRVLTEHAAFYTGKTPRVLLTERGIIYRDEELKGENTPVCQQRDPAQIPENIRKRMDNLFAKLDEAYPGKVIMRLNQDHKQWAKTVTELYRLLGYESPKDFLTAYGYTYGSTDDKGGRPKKNPMEIIEELQRRYPNGTAFTTVDELKAANPDIASRFQSLRNKSNEYFGMPFTQYLRSIGLIK